MTMKRTLMAALVAAFAAGGCAAPGTETKQAVDLVGTSWLAEDIGGTPVADGVKSTLGFVEPGRVAGRGGCNRFFGAVTITGQSMEFGKMGSTMMACPPPIMEHESRYMNALGEAKRFEVKDGTLLIFGSGPASIIRFTQMEPE